MLQEIFRRQKKDNDAKELERQFYAAIHGGQYRPQLSDDYHTNVQQQALAETSKETDAKIEAHMKKKMAEMEANAALKRDAQNG